MRVPFFFNFFRVRLSSNNKTYRIMNDALYFIGQFRHNAYTAASHFCEENKGTFLDCHDYIVSADHLTERERIEYNLVPDDELSCFAVVDYIECEIVAYFCYVEEL